VYFVRFYVKQKNYSRSNSSIGKNVMFRLHRYKCNVENVLSGQMNNITESHFIRSIPTVCMCISNLLSEIIIVRDGFLSLPTWFSRDFIDDVISSVCV